MMVDTGFIVNESLKGGKFGPYAFSQSNVIWSNIEIECNGKFFCSCLIELLIRIGRNVDCTL